MSKSHAKELSNVYEAIFRDATYAFPTLKAEFERDLARLKVLSVLRGIRVYLVDLPAVGKHLDRCLANGQYLPSGLPLTKRYTGGVVIPKFLRGLYLLVFEENGRLKDEYDVEAVVFLRQILYLVKKAPFACSPEDIENEVLEFYETDLSLPEPEGFWDKPAQSCSVVEETYHGYGKSHIYLDRIGTGDSLCGLSANRSSLDTLDKVAGIIATTLGSYEPLGWRFRHGPGAISEVSRPVNKFCWRGWSTRLGSVFPISEYGFYNLHSWGRSVATQATSSPTDPFFLLEGEEERASCQASRMVAVPKTFTKPRLIAAEPSEHQWCQQNIWHYFCQRSQVTWISSFVQFTDQTLNQDLCRRGSKDGSLATVDLSAASDRVTCHAIGQFYRSNPSLLAALSVTRTQYVTQNLTRKVPACVRLRKFSTMGNACTFPVESLLFLGIALAATLQSRNLSPTLQNIRSLEGEVAVFGDDIVIPVDSRELFVSLLEVLHFKINEAKSFWTGRFRESCGVDSFNGVEVTPIYWKGAYDGKPESLSRVTQTSNNFYQKFLLETAAHLESTLPTAWLPLVAMRSGVFGLQTRNEPENTHLTMRYNSGLQLVQCQVLQPIAVTRRTKTNDDSSLLQYFTEEPLRSQDWSHGYNERTLLKIKKRWVSLSDLAAQPDEMERELVLLHQKASAARTTLLQT